MPAFERDAYSLSRLSEIRHLFLVMPLHGHASAAGTSRYRDRLGPSVSPEHFRLQQSLFLSSIGIGTYLGNADSKTDGRYRNAVVRAAKLGANVIDTASNYRFQRSERSIGEALTLLSEFSITRDELLICTKGGYLPFDGAPPRDVRGYIEETFVRPDIASISDFVGGSHCMTPAYIGHQLQQSLANMNLECVDVYYIHNPESQLGSVSESEFYTRIQAAFEFLECARAEEKIRMYGVATWNGFRTAPSSGSYHSLERMAELARAIAGEEHGFRFIQVPFNLGMPEALTLRNQSVKGVEVSTVDAANAMGITVMVSASLLQGRVARGLPPEIREPLGSLSSDAQTAIQFVRSTPGVTTALVGMSSVAHVEENLELAKVAPATEREFSRLFSAS